MGAKQIQIFSDSQLVVHQVNQDFTAKDISMTASLQHTHHLLATFDAYLISQFLRNQTLPVDPAEARRVRYRSARYLIINGSLYNRGFSLPYHQCLTPEEDAQAFT
ncbi:hypothetical protein L3X38_025443 [Prunus dulcis]|uniref:RNase H type-1 domain-containing protein n=1 Tax=Prunus dulcis TaxID=3755 RepID=A0AAD4W1N1_PRUDU|nr:hypothetical protein L3X38_025443 [Prunus dulcis]